MKYIFNKAVKTARKLADKTADISYAMVSDKHPRHIRLNGDYPFHNQLFNYAYKPNVVFPVLMYLPYFLSEKGLDYLLPVAAGILVSEVLSKTMTEDMERRYFGSSYDSRCFRAAARPKGEFINIVDIAKAKSVLRGYEETKPFIDTISLSCCAGVFALGVIDGTQEESIVPTALHGLLAYSAATAGYRRVQASRYRAVVEERWTMLPISPDDNNNDPKFDHIAPV